MQDKDHVLNYSLSFERIQQKVIFLQGVECSLQWLIKQLFGIRWIIHEREVEEKVGTDRMIPRQRDTPGFKNKSALYEWSNNGTESFYVALQIDQQDYPEDIGVHLQEEYEPVTGAKDAYHSVRQLEDTHGRALPGYAQEGRVHYRARRNVGRSKGDLLCTDRSGAHTVFLVPEDKCGII